MKLGSIIVLYNKKIDESHSYNSAKNHVDNIVLFDNTVVKELQDYNQKYAQEHGLNYITLHKNCGLSKAYNECFNYFRQTDVDNVILMDDDTSFNQDYFDAITTIKDNNIYAPIIYCDNRIVNPHYRTGCIFNSYLKQKKYSKLENLKKLENTNRLAAINSGLVLPKSFVDKYHFDESIFLDCVDWKLCDDAYKMGYNIKILPTKIEQNFSVNELANTNMESLQKRFEIRLTDLKNYSKKLYFLNKLALIMVYILNTRKLGFLKYLFY